MEGGEDEEGEGSVGLTRAASTAARLTPGGLLTPGKGMPSDPLAPGEGGQSPRGKDGCRICCPLACCLLASRLEDADVEGREDEEGEGSVS